MSRLAGITRRLRFVFPEKDYRPWNTYRVIARGNIRQNNFTSVVRFSDGAATAANSLSIKVGAQAVAQPLEWFASPFINDSRPYREGPGRSSEIEVNARDF